jgi:Tfp pilus assembly protein PilP
MADNHSKKEEVVDKAKEITKKLQEDGLDEVPLNDPFAGNEGTSGSLDASIPDEEKEDVMSLYNFKLAGLISGKDNSYISLVNSGGEVITVTIGQFLGKIKLVDMRLNEAIFEKEDKSFVIIDFNNVIREADEY